MTKHTVTDKELAMIKKAARSFRGEDFDSDTVLDILDGFQGHSNPLVSHGLNRIIAWLSGPDGRWAGDDRIRVTWYGDVCTLEHDGQAWQLSLGVTANRKRRVKLARLMTGEETASLASGTEYNFNGLTWGLLEIGGEDEADITFERSIDAEVSVGAFEEFCDFMDVIKPSIPQTILDVTAGTVWVEKADEFLTVRELVRHDGGLPGRLCRSLDHTNQVLGARSGLLSVTDRFQALSHGLAERGAVWGQNILHYNDDDCRCCVVSTGDNSVALYSEHTASGRPERGYVAVFDLGSDGRAASVSGYLLEGDDDATLVSSIVDQSASPAFHFDVSSNLVEFAEGRKGHHALRLMLLQFAYDEEFALKDGELRPVSRQSLAHGMEP
jgi:hypothetical protein